MSLSEERLKDFVLRIERLKEETEQTTDVICFVEIRLTKEQINVIAKPLFGWSEEELFAYYRQKINGEILQSCSKFTTREDQPDFQYLVDLGVSAVKKKLNEYKIR